MRERRGGVGRTEPSGERRRWGRRSEGQRCGSGGPGAGRRAQREVLRAGTADGDQQLGVPRSEGRGGNPTAGAGPAAQGFRWSPGWG